MSVVRATNRAFEEILCDCGHTFGQHPWYDNPRGRGGLCSLCPCRRRQDAEVTAWRERQLAIAADPNHVHGSSHTAYACPGFVPFQVCDECGATVA